MKTKKIISIATSVALASALCFSLAACGDGADDKKPGSEAKDVVSEKLTKEQWTDAFKASNFEQGKVVHVTTQKGKFSFGSASEGSDGEEGESDMVTYNGTVMTTTTYTIDGDRQYRKIVYSATGDKGLVEEAKKQPVEERYTGKVSDHVVVRYYKDEPTDTKWTWDVGSRGLFDESISFIVNCASLYDSFEYKANQNGYMIKSGDPAEKYYRDMVFKFKDKKLSAVYGETDMKSDGQEYHTTQSFTISYGKQTVTLPTDLKTFAYTGTWKTDHLEINGESYAVGDDVPGAYLGSEEATVTVTADTVSVVLNADGTASFKYAGASGKGAWEWYSYTQEEDGWDGEYGYFYSDDLPESTGGSLNIEYDKDEQVLSFTMSSVTVALKKA